MKSVLALFAFLVAAGQVTDTLADPAEDLTLSAETPVVEVSPRRAGRQFFDLPALEYAFDVQARCAEEWTPESISLNVADSRVRFGSAERSPTTGRKVTVSVPARQLAPVAVHDFCLDPADPVTAEPGASTPPSPETSPLTIRAVLSAQASLLCVSAEERRITYVSTPLDVILTCRSAAAVDTGD